MTAVRFAPGMAGCMLAGVLLAGAALTKQTALILCLPLFLYTFVFRPRQQALCFTGFFIVTLGLVSLWLNATTQGWYFFYTFEIPRQHPVLWHRMDEFWLNQIIKPLGIASLPGRLFLFFNFPKKIPRTCAAARTLLRGLVCGLLHALD